MVVDFVDCVYVYNDKSIHIEWSFSEKGEKMNQHKKSLDLLQGWQNTDTIELENQKRLLVDYSEQKGFEVVGIPPR